jgi:hypothetical protein
MSHQTTVQGAIFELQDKVNEMFDYSAQLEKRIKQLEMMVGAPETIPPEQVRGIMESVATRSNVPFGGPPYTWDPEKECH